MTDEQTLTPNIENDEPAKEVSTNNVQSNTTTNTTTNTTAITTASTTTNPPTVFTGSNIYERNTTISKVKKIKLFRNGDRFYSGMTYAVSSDRCKTLDSLLTDLTSSPVCDKNVLPMGVRYLFSLEGDGRVDNLEDLVDGKSYVCSSTNNFNNKIPYQASEIPVWNTNAFASHSYYNSSLPCSPVFPRRGHLHLKNMSRDPSIVENLDENDTDFVRPKLMTVFRNGPKPRRAAKVLLNKRTAHTMEQAMEEINQSIKLDSGALKKVFSVTGKQVTCLQDFFGDDVIFFAFGHEQPSADNFVLTNSELQFISGSKMLRYQQPSLNSPQNVKNWTSPNDKALSKSRDNSFIGQQSVASRTPVPFQERGITNSNGHSSTKECQDTQPPPMRVKYKVGKVIGEGKFAVVRECTEKARKLPFALKMINKSKVREDYAALKNEVAILRRVKHENIVQLIEEYETPTHHYLIFELVNGGDLFELISQMNNYCEKDACSMIKDICKGVSYLHALNIVHRDIKPENILVHRNKNGQKILKLADMGLATYATEPLLTVCGTPTYVAPEVIAEVGYGLKADIWSIGVLTYILLCGFPPFSSDIDDQDELFDKILEGKFDFVSPYWDDVSDKAKELIGSMLCLDVSERPTADELLCNPWIVGAPGSTNQKLDQSVSSKIEELHNKSIDPSNSCCAMTNTALDKTARCFEGKKQNSLSECPIPDSNNHLVANN